MKIFLLGNCYCTAYALILFLMDLTWRYDYFNIITNEPRWLERETIPTTVKLIWKDHHLLCLDDVLFSVLQVQCTRMDPSVSISKLFRIGLVFTQDPTNLNPLLKVIPFGSDPKKVSCKQMGSDPNDMDGK